MSASIFYQPVKGKYLSIGAPQSFLDLLERIGFSRDGCYITDRSAYMLEVAANTTENTEFRAALKELAEAATKHGEIRLWPEY